MNRAKSTIVPIVLLVVFGLAFAAGIRSLQSNRAGGAEKGGDRSGKLNFAADTSAAFATAKGEGKVVMVKYGAEWCPPCNKMEKEAFTDTGVAELLKDVVVVDIDVDKPGADKDWLDGHSPSEGIPTVEFYRADGTKVGELVGYGSLDEFKADVMKVLAKA